MLRKDHILQDIYERRSQETLHKWLTAEKHSCCDAAVSFYSEDLQALTSGIQPVLNQGVISLLADIRSLSKNDLNAEVMSDKNFHITFLAITQSIYKSDENIPNVSELTEIFRHSVRSSNIRIKELRLVALPNQLLLAGIPDKKAVNERRIFWDAVMASEWREKMQDRYPNKEQPPEFWHTTLLRYKSAYLPPLIREYFLSHRNNRYGGLSGKIKLVFTRYDWNEPLIII